MEGLVTVSKCLGLGVALAAGGESSDLTPSTVHETRYSRTEEIIDTTGRDVRGLREWNIMMWKVCCSVVLHLTSYRGLQSVPRTQEGL
jgi:hypothetical protein